MRTEQVMFWSAVALYGVSTFAYIMGFIARSERLLGVALVAAVLGFVPHTSSIATRWILAAATPFLTIAESLTLATWMSVLLYLVAQFAWSKFRPVGVLVVPICFALIGWAGTLRTGPATVQQAPALQSGWLWIHIVGASTGFSAVLIAAALGLLYLLKVHKQGAVYDRLPTPEALDELSYRFVGGGFTLYGVMIVSGAFWANQAKGSFWNWDPVEVWSLISWLVYGIYLHLRVTMGWRGTRLAVYSLAAVAVMILSYWGIPFSMETFHSGFRIEH